MNQAMAAAVPALKQVQLETWPSYCILLHGINGSRYNSLKELNEFMAVNLSLNNVQIYKGFRNKLYKGFKIYRGLRNKLLYWQWGLQSSERLSHWFRFSRQIWGGAGKSTPPDFLTSSLRSFLLTVLKDEIDICLASVMKLRPEFEN